MGRFGSTLYEENLINKGFKLCDIKSVVKFLPLNEVDSVMRPFEFYESEIEELIESVLDYDRERQSKIEYLREFATINETRRHNDFTYEDEYWYDYEDDYYQDEDKILNKQGFELCDIKSVIKFSSLDEVKSVMSPLEFCDSELKELIETVLDYDGEKNGKIEFLRSFNAI